MQTVRVVWGGIAVVVVAAVLAVVGQAGPVAAIEPTAIVPTGVAAPPWGLSCPTDDVCWSAGTEEGPGGDLVGVVHRIVGGVQEASTPIPVGTGQLASPTAIDCWSATDCAVIVDVTTAEDPTGHPAVSYVLGGVPSAPEEIVVPGASDPAFGLVACHGPVCEVAGSDAEAPIFSVIGYVATVSPGVAPVVDELPDTAISDIDCVGDGTCVVVGWTGSVFFQTGILARRGPGGLTDVQESELFPSRIECETATSCLYTAWTPADGASVGWITADGVQPPTPVPGLEASLFDLSCRAGLDACLAVGHDFEHGVTLLIEDGAPGELSVIEELRLVTVAGCGATSCLALGYAEIGEALDPSEARLLTGFALPVDPVATQLQVDPALLKLRVLNLKLSIGTVSARLVDAEGVPLAGKPVAFTAAGTPLCTALTGLDGRATCTTGLAGLLAVVLGGGVHASFAGDETSLPSQGSAGLIG